MDWNGLVDRLLPVATLLLGASLTGVGNRRNRRRQASEALAELYPYMWTKGTEDGWVNLQVFMGKLRVALTSAGVPSSAVRRFDQAVKAAWQSVEHSGDPETGLIADSTAYSHFEAEQTRISIFLERPWVNYWRIRSNVPAGSDDD